MLIRLWSALFGVLFAVIPLAARSESSAATSINAFGLDLYRQQVRANKDVSLLFSPYSISTALAMTYAGASGETKTEMQRVLHFSSDQAGNSAKFQNLEKALTDLLLRSRKWVQKAKDEGEVLTPIELTSANRLFVQQGYSLHPDFTKELSRYFGSDLAKLDFQHNAAGARIAINHWVATKTRDRIPELLPAGLPSEATRLAIVNALYLKAQWNSEFYEAQTKDESFHLNPTTHVMVPTMLTTQRLGYAKESGFSVVTVPYQTGSLQLVLFIPDKVDGLAALEKSLTAEKLAQCAQLKSRLVTLRLPKFKLEPGTLPLAEALQALGLRSAFDRPPGTANFERMAPRTRESYLFVGNVFHKAWLSLDEHGTEATAATVVLLSFGAASMPLKPPPPPIELRADRPFLFAIQHVESGACLFLGRELDPREN